MLFNNEEITILISALETYNDAPRNELRPELQNTLVNSSIEKLENLTALTYFTKQEFSIMALAMNFIIQSLEISGNIVDDFTFTLFHRLIALAEPST